MKQAIIFDMDGTLFQTNLILEPALDTTFSVLREKGLWSGPTPIETYREIMGVPLPVVWATLCPEHSQETHESSNLLFQQALIEQIQLGNGALYSGVEETLADLSSQFPLFIASNGQRDYLRAIVDVYRLDRWIQSVHSIDGIPSGHKSDLVASVLSQNDVEGGFVVGDRSSDVQAALDNNLTSIGVRFDFAQEEELAKAHHVVDRFEDIILLVTRAE